MCKPLLMMREKRRREGEVGGEVFFMVDAEGARLDRG
jgi:hypothetical protein